MRASLGLLTPAAGQPSKTGHRGDGRLGGYRAERSCHRPKDAGERAGRHRPSEVGRPRPRSACGSQLRHPRRPSQPEARASAAGACRFGRRRHLRPVHRRCRDLKAGSSTTNRARQAPFSTERRAPSGSLAGLGRPPPHGRVPPPPPTSRRPSGHRRQQRAQSLLSLREVEAKASARWELPAPWTPQRREPELAS